MSSGHSSRSSSSISISSGRRFFTVAVQDPLPARRVQELLTVLVPLPARIRRRLVGGLPVFGRVGDVNLVDNAHDDRNLSAHDVLRGCAGACCGCGAAPAGAVTGSGGASNAPRWSIASTSASAILAASSSDSSICTLLAVCRIARFAAGLASG